jgi:hypothetical protein
MPTEYTLRSDPESTSGMPRISPLKRRDPRQRGLVSGNARLAKSGNPPRRLSARSACPASPPPPPSPPLLPFPRSEGVYRWIIKSRILDTCFFSQWRRNVNSALWKRRSALITVTSTARRAWRTSRSRSCSLRFCQGADVNIDRPNCAITQQLGPEEHSFANRGRLVNSARPDPAKVSRRVRLTRPTESHDRNFRWFYVAH